MALKLNFCPPIEASYIKPPFGSVKIATPSLYSTSTATPAVNATADACAPNSKFPRVNLLSASTSLKNMISLNAWAPNCRPILSCVTSVLPIKLPFSKT